MAQFYQNDSYVKFRAKGSVMFGYVKDYNQINKLYKIQEHVPSADKLKHTFIDDTHWVTERNICRVYGDFDDKDNCVCGSFSVGSDRHQKYCNLFKIGE